MACLANSGLQVAVLFFFKYLVVEHVIRIITSQFGSELLILDSYSMHGCVSISEEVQQCILNAQTNHSTLTEDVVPYPVMSIKITKRFCNHTPK